jgi:2-keto-4-pentenoate hydratase/2-oxohepta-3-ene-1,7-dioic acid hydratase in catechol pathway
MRICRFTHQNQTQVGFYDEQEIVPIAAVAKAYAETAGERLPIPTGDNLLDFLPPQGSACAATQRLADWLKTNRAKLPAGAAIATGSVQLHVPIPRPNKIFLLAGNYADHIKEGGGVAAERAETFPYVFMKPPTTTLNDPGKPVRIPRASPGAIDWELELAVIIGQTAKAVREANALKYVAGYTVINDISDRKFRPNPNRKKRDRDAFFDWLHGKWHDSFCPCGPCVTSADSIGDPQSLAMTLKLNGEVRQNASTGLQIFPVAAVIEFISNLVTLEPGDIISTGTPAGVGSSTGTFVKPGDVLEASIERIGTLVSPVAAE